MAIRVAVNGYGTIGKRVADAVALQKGIKIAGTIQDLMGKVDVIVDGAPKKIGKENLEKFYKPNRIKATFQGGEKHSTAGTSFVAQCNYDEAVGKDYVRVVSCNTTGLVRTLNEINRLYGIDSVHATMIRRGADPADIYHGPINGIVPVLEMPSHHGPDVQTVLKGVEIFTTALSVSTTLMHVHSIIADLKRKPDIQEVIQRFKDAARIRVVRNAEVIRSTAQIMELAKDLGFARGDMPENVDAIRAMMGEKDAQKSIRMTNEAMGIK